MCSLYHQLFGGRRGNFRGIEKDEGSRRPTAAQCTDIRESPQPWAGERESKQIRVN